LSTTNLTWTDLGTNPGICSERLASNSLSHGMAVVYSRIGISPPFYVKGRKIQPSKCNEFLSIKIFNFLRNRQWMKPKTKKVLI
jgi:hypothetical protein